MSQTPSFDPAAAWQKMVSRWEQEINSWSGKITESQQFGEVMAQATKMQIMAQRSFHDHMEKVLKSLNLPSKAQVEALSERLDRIEESIERLTIALASAEGAPAKPAPKRTRKPPPEAE